MLHDTKHDLSQDSQDFLNAADYIDQHGWCQGTAHKLSGEVCLWGAIVAVTDGLDKLTSSSTVHRALELYDMLGADLGMPAAKWNDKLERTKDEVTAFLRKKAMESKE